MQERQLPGGTVTFLFTDIEGSTHLLEDLGERYAEVLEEHRRLLREAFSRHGGVEVDTQGDSFFIVFERANDAVAAARDVQQTPTTLPVRVRVGIHTGEPVITEWGYVGLDVHRAARIMDAAHGGQVLVSDATRQLLGSTVKLRDLGEHRLKDLGAPQRLHQLGNGDFPPLRALHQTNLPTQPTSLVGRERELEEAGALIASHRLLTLTGPGGSGKTRLALQLAADAVEQFPHGVFWIPLQGVRDAALVEGAIATAVGAETDLVAHIADKRILLLLDNFEQVIEAASTVSLLLAGTPAAKVLITSREPLHLGGEHCYPVDPLPQNDAEVLFVERARAVDPGFRPTGAVREICRRVDGLPLAIELAAARVALLEPHELLTRLDSRLSLLASRSPDAPTRQRTLRATIAWSYELLEPGEQQLFRRLGVFPGTFSLEAAEAVCEADLDTVEALVFKSLVRRLGSGRFGMLDTIREYALDRLVESPEVEGIRRRHAEFYLAVAESANLNAGKWDVEREIRPDIAFADQDNIRGALEWTVARGQVALGLELATAMDFFWVINDPHEGRRWFGSLLGAPEAGSVSPEIRAHALRAYGGSTDIAGEDKAAERLYEQSLALFDQLGDELGRAQLMMRLSVQAMRRGALEHARELAEVSHEIHERKDSRWGQAQSIGMLGAIARDAGNLERAYELITESREIAREIGWWESGMLAELAQLSMDAGRFEEGEAAARESLSLAEGIRDRAGRVFGVGLLARAAAERGQPEHAGRLWGAIEHEDAVAPLGGWRRHRDACAARIRRVADPGFERGYTEGRDLTLDEAVALALTASGSSEPA